LLHFQNVRKIQVVKKCKYCYLTNKSILTFSELQFSEHLGNEARRRVFSDINLFIPFQAYTVNVTGETTVLNKNLAQHKARILPILSWKSWENRVFPTIKQGFPQQKASKILF